MKGSRTLFFWCHGRAQSAAAEGCRNKKSIKTPAGVFMLFLFAREARRTAPRQRAEARKSDVRINGATLRRLYRAIFPPPSGGTPNFGNAQPPPMWEGVGRENLIIAFAQRIPFKKVRRRCIFFISLVGFLHAPSPRGEGRGGVAKNSMSAANSL